MSGPDLAVNLKKTTGANVGTRALSSWKMHCGEPVQALALVHLICTESKAKSLISCHMTPASEKNVLLGDRLDRGKDAHEVAAEDLVKVGGRIATSGEAGGDLRQVGGGVET